jgi:hypothetical protein
MHFAAWQNPSTDSTTVSGHERFKQQKAATRRYTLVIGRRQLTPAVDLQATAPQQPIGRAVIGVGGCAGRRSLCTAPPCCTAADLGQNLKRRLGAFLDAVVVLQRRRQVLRTAACVRLVIGVGVPPNAATTR